MANNINYSRKIKNMIELIKKVLVQKVNKKTLVKNLNKSLNKSYQVTK